MDVMFDAAHMGLEEETSTSRSIVVGGVMLAATTLVAYQLGCFVNAVFSMEKVEGGVKFDPGPSHRYWCSLAGR